MRTIERTGQFRRDYKREIKGQHRTALATELPVLVADLATDAAIATRHRDHALSGDWTGHRDCHLRPNLVLIYRKVGHDTLQLIRLASHAELGW